MGERVKWATTQDGNCAHAALYSKGVRASVWADGDWRLFDNADSMIANGKAERRTLEAAKLAAAMQTPQGRRVLAVQAVEEAVADGARRGLDAEALRVVLADAVERCSGPADSYIGSIVRDLVEYPDDVDTWPMVDYRRALAARSAKPLGRPSCRRRER